VTGRVYACQHGAMSETLVGVAIADYVVTVELLAGPHNFASAELLHAAVDAAQSAIADGARAVLLCSEGKSFCAGAQFSGGSGEKASGFGKFIQTTDADSDIGPFYEAALRIFSIEVPVVAAVHGPAVGAGFGLATACDLRVTCPEAFFATNFVKLGIHPGFGISVTLPELLGPAQAADLLLTGRRVGGEEAFALGLASRLVPQADVRSVALALATEIAANAPLAVRATRATLRDGLATRVRTALLHERKTQDWLSATADAEEGIAAMLERRPPVFTGK
jgi:enoyl-CoA hydratase/carnithine racemase